MSRSFRKGMSRDAVSFASSQHGYDGGKSFTDHVRRASRESRALGGSIGSRTLGGSASSHEIGDPEITLSAEFTELLMKRGKTDPDNDGVVRVKFGKGRSVESKTKLQCLDIDARLLELENRQWQQQQEITAITNELANNLRDQMNEKHVQLEERMEKYVGAICEELIAELTKQLLPMYNGQQLTTRGQQHMPDGQSIDLPIPTESIPQSPTKQATSKLRAGMRAALETPFDAIHRLRSLDDLVAQHSRQLTMMDNNFRSMGSVRDPLGVTGESTVTARPLGSNIVASAASLPFSAGSGTVTRDSSRQMMATGREHGETDAVVVQRSSNLAQTHTGSVTDVQRSDELLRCTLRSDETASETATRCRVATPERDPGRSPNLSIKQYKVPTPERGPRVLSCQSRTVVGRSVSPVRCLESRSQSSTTLPPNHGTEETVGDGASTATKLLFLSTGSKTNGSSDLANSDAVTQKYRSNFGGKLHAAEENVCLTVCAPPHAIKTSLPSTASTISSVGTSVSGGTTTAVHRMFSGPASHMQRSTLPAQTRGIGVPLQAGAPYSLQHVTIPGQNSVERSYSYNYTPLTQKQSPTREQAAPMFPFKAQALEETIQPHQEPSVKMPPLPQSWGNLEQSQAGVRVLRSPDIPTRTVVQKNTTNTEVLVPNYRGTSVKIDAPISVHALMHSLTTVTDHRSARPGGA